MATGTSSARYRDLYHYARTAEALDQELIAQADKLISRLSYFEATCEEPAFRVSSDGLGSALRSHGTRAIPVEQRVHKVGEAFQKADKQAHSFLGRVALDPVGRWIFKAFRPATLAVADNELGLDFVYTVKRGDTLSNIAKRFGITVDDILWENQVPNRDLIHPGLILVIPGAQPVQQPKPVVGPKPIPQPVLTPENPEPAIGSKPFRWPVIALPPQLIENIKDVPVWLGDKTGGLRDRIDDWLRDIARQIPRPSSGPIGGSVPQPPSDRSIEADEVDENTAESGKGPIHLEEISLHEVKPEDRPLGNCVEYAKLRIHWLGSSGDNPTPKGGAHNYLYKFKESKFQISETDDDLTHIRPGYALVWPPTIEDSDAGVGHVAVIEEVEGGRVRISDTNWDGGGYRDHEWYTIDKLRELGLWIIAPPAEQP